MSPEAAGEELPVAHVDDEAGTARLIALLSRLHGPDYEFAVRTYRGGLSLYPVPHRLQALFFLRASSSAVTLYAGDLVRGPDANLPCRMAEQGLHEITERTYTPVWPGDTLCVDGRSRSMAALSGQGAYLSVTAPLTDYAAPRLSVLRNLRDLPGGCAAYKGAFRREALPPARQPEGAEDARGPNRVNMHALDMRTDRDPPPSRHHHGPVPIGEGRKAAHSETALVLPRAVYGLPPHAGDESEHIVLYPDVLGKPEHQVRVPAPPGTIAVTPAAADCTMGHAFENAFAMLVAIPGFVSPYRYLD